MTTGTVMIHQGRKLLVAVTLVTLLNSGCSPKGASQLSAADRYFSAGEYEKAEIEYKNALQAKKTVDPRAIGQLGIIYFQQGRLRQAIPYLLKARELDPNALEVREKLAIVYRLSGKSNESRDEAEYILAHNPTNSNAPLILVQAAATSQVDTAAAETRLRQLPDGVRESAPVLSALAVIELGRKNLNTAESLLRRALIQDPKNVSAHAALAALLVDSNRSEQADAELRTAVELAPPRTGPAIQYARFKLQRGDGTSARTILEDIAAKAPDYLPAQSMLAELAASEKRYDDCTALIAKVLAKDSTNPECVLLGARLKLARGDPGKAADDLETLLKYYPKSPQALYFLGLAYAGAGEKSKAIDRMTQCIKIAPTPEAIGALSVLYLRNGDSEAAIRLLKPFVDANPAIPQPKLALADIYRSRGNTTEALTLYKQVEKEVPSNPQGAYESGITLLLLKRPAEAREAFELALQRAPGFMPALEQLCGLDLTNNDFKSALTRVEKELARDPNSAPAHLLGARIFVAKNDPLRAETEFKRAIELKPEVPAAYLQLARLYASSNQQQKALSSLHELSARNPRDVSALLLTGLILDQQKDYAAARGAYEKVLALNPKSSVALNNLAYLYCERLGEIDKAYELAQKARELMPDQAQTADTLGWTLYKKGQYERAQDLLEQAVAALPNEADVHFHLGSIRYALGQEASARTSLERALELNSGSEFADDIRRRVSVLSTNLDDASDGAIAALRKAVSAAPEDAVALTHLARLLERRGSRDEAISSYLAAAKANPKSPLPQLGLARLYVETQQTQKAFEAAKLARKIAPEDAEIAQTLGSIAFRIGERTWAASLLQEALRKQPEDPNLLFETAQAIYRLGQVAEARDHMISAIELSKKPVAAISTQAGSAPWKHALEASRFLEMTQLAIKPDLSAYDNISALQSANHSDVPILMAYGRLLEERDETQSAVQTYQQVLGSLPEFTPVKLRLAVLSARQNRPNAKALEWAQQARTAYPSDPEAARTLGILILLNGGDASRAISLLKEGLPMFPNDPELLYYLGRTQVRTKDVAAGRANLQKALSTGLQGEFATDAKALLKTE